MTQLPDLTTILDECFKNVTIDASAKRAIIQTILLNVQQYSSTSRFQQRLDILYQHEKNYFNLVKDFKEEIRLSGISRGVLK